MRVKTKIGAVVGAGAAILAISTGGASATQNSSTMNLAGGDQLQANAWHCGTYFKACSFTASAKVLGTHPSYAASVTNQTEVAVHGIVLDISLGTTKNFGVVYTQSGLVRSRWTNYNAWISDSSGTVNVSPLSTYVSTKETASAYDPIFGSPSGLSTTAGAV